MLRNDIYVPIPVNADISAKANNALQEKIFNRSLQHYTEPPSFHLLQTEQTTYKLIPNHALKNPNQPGIAEPTEKQPKDHSYIFVVTQGNEGRPQLKIGEGSHFHLSNKATQVLAAGEITFKEGHIVSINDQSGAFHLDCLSEEEEKHYQDALKAVMEKVGMPFDLYTPFKKESNCLADTQESIALPAQAAPEKTSHWTNFFQPAAIIEVPNTSYSYLYE